MKKALFLTAILISSIALFSQQDDIIYMDFEQDVCMTGLPDTQNIIIDINADGIDETLLYRDFGGHNGDPWYVVIHSTNYPDETEWHYLFLYDGLTDTLSMLNDHYRLGVPYSLPYDYSHSSPAYDVTRTLRFGVRHTIHNDNGENHYCYGWIEGTGRWTWDPEAWWAMLTVCIDRMAFCTIPDYPLLFGQTSLNDVEEVSEVAPLKIHPNPAKHVINIEISSDVSCTCVQIYSLDGRLVKSQRGDTDSIDISCLADGVYVMKLTMSDGSEFSERIVKNY